MLVYYVPIWLKAGGHDNHKKPEKSGFSFFM